MKGKNQMILVKPSYKIIFIQPDLLELIELAGRTYYKSENKITEDSAEKFVKMVVKRGHHSVIEHANMTVRFICDRGVTHEIVRHRLAAYSQESTRYCNYKGGIAFVIPPWTTYQPGEYSINNTDFNLNYPEDLWAASVLDAEQDYIKLLRFGWSPQQARSVLPNSLKTEIVMTCNVREWLHILKLRTSKAAHPQMRELMLPLLSELKEKIPTIFDI